MKKESMVGLAWETNSWNSTNPRLLVEFLEIEPSKTFYLFPGFNFCIITKNCSTCILLLNVN
jgi:hypothetical protein